MLKIFFLHGLIILVFASCSMAGVNGVDGDSPDRTAVNVKQVNVLPKSRIEIYAEKVENYTVKDYSILYIVTASEIKDDGEINFKAGAERVKMNGNGDGSAEGNVFVENPGDDVRIDADFIELLDRERKLQAKGSIKVRSADGLTVYSQKLEADLSRKIYVFTVDVHGFITSKEKNEEDVRVEE